MLFLDLFKFCEQQNIVVSDVKNNYHNISFSWWLMDDMLADWNKILDDLKNFKFTNDEDSIF
jgi:hypothetical protein